jgi:hypothetical protein
VNEFGKDLEGSGLGLMLRHYPGIRLEGLRKTNLNQDIRSPGRDLNIGHLEYETGVLTTRPRLLGEFEITGT